MNIARIIDGPILVGIDEEEMNHLQGGGIVSFDLSDVGLQPQPMAIIHRATDAEIKAAIEGGIQQAIQIVTGRFN